jgi:hypothetical protein
VCYDNSVIHLSQLVDANKKADVDVDFYDEKTCRIEGGQSTVEKDFNTNLVVTATKVRK